jgi:hypothetical protein
LILIDRSSFRRCFVHTENVTVNVTSRVEALEKLGAIDNGPLRCAQE